jgi:DNA-directed RNA polymerase subunit RPC12/RpoP
MTPDRTQPIPDALPAEEEVLDALPAEEHAPMVGKRPPANKKFPCPQCGARLDFDPASRGLLCPYCGHQVVVEPTNQQVVEHDWKAYLQNRAREEVVLPGRSSEVKCSGCAAVVLLEDKVVTEKCPYCSRPLDNQPEAAHGMVQPHAVLPFAVTSKQACAQFDAWIASRWFAPNGLRKFSLLGQLAGAYMPFWTFDSMTYSAYRGQRGDNYTVTVYRNGKSQSETRIRWRSVSGEIQEFFDDVLVYASHSLPGDLVDELDPWDLRDLADFRHEYLSGFLAERYTVTPTEGFTIAQSIMDDRIRALVRQDIGGDHQRISWVQTQHVGVTFKHVLLPCWLASYRFHERTFRILVNARTGEVVGTRPWSWIKITLLVVAILLAIGGLILLFNH